MEKSCPYSNSEESDKKSLGIDWTNIEVDDILKFRDAHKTWRYKIDLSITDYKVDDSLLKDVYTYWVEPLNYKSKYILYKACTWRIVEEVYETVMKDIRAKLIFEAQLWPWEFIVWHKEIRSIEQKKSTQSKIYQIKKIILNKLSEYFRQNIRYIYDKSHISQKYNWTPNLPTIALLILESLADDKYIKQEINNLRELNQNTYNLTYKELPIGEIEPCFNIHIWWIQTAIDVCYRLVHYFIMNNVWNQCNSDKLRKCIKNSYSTFISMAQCNMFIEELSNIDIESDYLEYDKEKNMFRFSASKKDYENYYKEKPLNEPHSFKRCALIYKQWETGKSAILDFINIMFELYILYLERTNILKK